MPRRGSRSATAAEGRWTRSRTRPARARSSRRRTGSRSRPIGWRFAAADVDARSASTASTRRPTAAAGPRSRRVRSTRTPARFAAPWRACRGRASGSGTGVRAWAPRDSTFSSDGRAVDAVYLQGAEALAIPTGDTYVKAYGRLDDGRTPAYGELRGQIPYTRAMKRHAGDARIRRDRRRARARRGPDPRRGRPAPGDRSHARALRRGGAVPTRVRGARRAVVAVDLRGRARIPQRGDGPVHGRSGRRPGRGTRADRPRRPSGLSVDPPRARQGSR